MKVRPTLLLKVPLEAYTPIKEKNLTYNSFDMSICHKVDINHSNCMLLKWFYVKEGKFQKTLKKSFLFEIFQREILLIIWKNVKYFIYNFYNNFCIVIKPRFYFIIVKLLYNSLLNLFKRFKKQRQFFNSYYLAS